MRLEGNTLHLTVREARVLREDLYSAILHGIPGSRVPELYPASNDDREITLELPLDRAPPPRATGASDQECNDKVDTAELPKPFTPNQMAWVHDYVGKRLTEFKRALDNRYEPKQLMFGTRVRPR